jgi:hypothetical protein
VSPVGLKPDPPRGGRYEASQREAAYRVWRAAGQSLAETLRRLDRDHDWPLAKQTLADWRDEAGWVARAAADDAEDHRRERATQADTLTVLAALELHREQYERYFAGLAATGEVDPKATQAYSNLLRVLLAIKSGIAAEVQRELEQAGTSQPKPGGLTDEALAEIEAKIGLR